MMAVAGAIARDRASVAQRREHAWLARCEERMSDYGPDARMHLYRSAHLMMLDLPDNVAAEIREVVTATAATRHQ